MESESGESTIKELITQIHQLQKNVRDKELQIRKNEINYNYQVRNYVFFRNSKTIRFC